MQPLEMADIERQVHRAMCRYARALDHREWALLDQVFCPDVHYAPVGVEPAFGRPAAIALIRSFLDGCGPTQHLLGNLEVEADGDAPYSRCYVRAAHRGTGERSNVEFVTHAEYLVRWQLQPTGWRAREWVLRPLWHAGDISILGRGLNT